MPPRAVPNMSSEVQIEAVPQSRPYFQIVNSSLTVLLAAIVIAASVLVGQTINRQTRLIKGTRQELVALRHVVGSQTAEDVIFLKTIVLHPKIELELARTIAESVHKHALRFKRDPDLILAMIEIEANFEPDAVSSMGAVGLMQVLPQWADQLGIGCNLKEIDCNVRYGMQIYAFYDQMYKETDVALVAYNRGPGAVDWDLMHGRDPTRNGYAQKVLSVYDRLKEMSIGRQ